MKQRGALVCGVNVGLAGFSAADSQGNWTGLDVDICKALAAAVLSDPKKVKWVPLTAQARFTALQSGEVDILSRNTTWTLTRDASLGLDFVGVTYYDGQGFMVPKKTKITSAKNLKGVDVCVQSGTTTEKNLNDYNKSNDLNMKPVVFEGLEASVKAFLLRPLPGLHDGRFGPGLDSQQGGEQSRRLRDPARIDLQGAARTGGPPR